MGSILVSALESVSSDFKMLADEVIKVLEIELKEGEITSSFSDKDQWSLSRINSSLVETGADEGEEEWAETIP